MKGYKTLVEVTEGEMFPRRIQKPCERCGNFIDTTKDEKYMLFANVMTEECEDKPFESDEALIIWCPLCYSCSKDLAAFFKTNLSFRGKVVCEVEEIKEGKVGG